QRPCLEEGCGKHASFGEQSTGAIWCSQHSKPHHVDLVHKRRCEADGCVKQPSFGPSRHTLPRFCASHKPANFIDLKQRKCQHPFGCTKRPSFGDPTDGIARFCMQHKLRRHLNVKSRKCQEQGCAKQPAFGSAADLVVRFCAVPPHSTSSLCCPTILTMTCRVCGTNSSTLEQGRARARQIGEPE
ncbi:hypothetical protein T484DRAFT_1610275, partial [Baffinella frigidus]